MTTEWHHIGKASIWVLIFDKMCKKRDKDSEMYPEFALLLLLLVGTLTQWLGFCLCVGSGVRYSPSFLRAKPASSPLTGRQGKGEREHFFSFFNGGKRRKKENGEDYLDWYCESYEPH